jgi:hypothetical protein
MRVVLLSFMWLAAAGFVASVVAHVLGTIGVDVPKDSPVWGLHVGIFVVWIPAVLVSMRTSLFTRRKEFWKTALKGCPPWVEKAGRVLFFYAIASFFVFIAGRPFWPLPATDQSWQLRGFSGHWMIFYGAAFAILYSALNRPELLQKRLCPQGHDVSHEDRFCPTCGSSLAD